ncbi:bifunctional DNA-formamidopyrimidine glycosylase/DNA-(apurinic or apyrimidinic site) lyase [Pelagibius litoralis]|uniref:Formamidopyrimidine-DNA glycosylase n=1 Tax=Pelagibius litoralis TaxID=374515 RepID=A0A967EVP0_9PROT|nr:bifunctional DNA-formamidopyrimidine glycosylase/DNA-(apurinic or apyrimidinic site) lyase [Pelagibius litoralis]NIA68119.1 bifunctional DNA-formamidopyrimidine glycosylase/DNA-(apurinic or apyrimidinic site) lyase [Pelagibius litoralis]
MPELPEVETVVRGLRPRMEGRRLARVEQRRPNLRFPFPENFAARLTGRKVERILRRAKYMLLHLDDGQVLLCHLGMSGRMVIHEKTGRQPPAPLDRHDHVVFTTDQGTEIRFNDARRFGVMDLFAGAELDSHPLLKDLGPEPLGNDFNGPGLAAALKGKRSPIKAALLDQRVVAGLGNIYVCEALFLAGLSPRRQAYTVQGGRAERLAAAVRQVLTRAIEAGGSSLRDYVQADGELGYFQHEWAVYGREGEACPGCDCDPGRSGGIARLVQSGRSTFYCARRQR